MKRQGWFGNPARLVYGILLLAGLGSVTPPAEAQAPAATPPVAEAPTFKIGDEWRWEGGDYPTYVRVVALEGDGSVVESNLDVWCRDGCRYTRDKNGIGISGVSGKGEPTYVSGLKILDFPLTVGKEWTQQKELRNMRTGQMIPYFNVWKVEAFEEVKVKAGTFKAFRISYSQEARGSYRWSGNASLWWSPDVKAFVKRVVHSSDWGRDWELASYSLK